MKQALKKGATDQSLLIFIQDSSSTTGAGKTGLAYNTASLVCYYARPGEAAAALSLVTQTVTGSHSDGGFVEVDATNMPGVYRLDLSDAILAAGVNSVVVMLKGASGMAPITLEIQLTDFDLNTSTQKVDLDTIKTQAITCAAGVTVLASVGTAATSTAQTGDSYAIVNGDHGLVSIQDDIDAILADTNELQADMVNGGRVDLLIDGIKAKTDNLPASPANEATLTTIAGYLDTEIAAILADTNELQTNQGNWVTATGFATATELAKVPKSDGSASWNTTALAAIQNECKDALDAYDPPTNAEMVAAIPTAAAITDAVWDEAISGHLTGGTTGNALNAAGSAGDPWSTSLPGAYGAGTAGKIIGDNINAPIATVDTVVDAIKVVVDNIHDTDLPAVKTETAAIKAKTDNLPSDPADESAIEAAITAATSGLATAAALTTVDGIVDAIKAKTDSLTFTKAGEVDANIQSVNDTALVGNGSTTPWGPA